MEYSYLFAAIILGLVSFGTLFYLKEKKIYGSDKKKFRWTYVFIGPYLIELLNKELHGRKKLLKKSELIGWGFVFLLLIVVITFDL